MFLVLEAKQMSLFNTFFCWKNSKYPPKIKILANVNTSSSTKNKNLDYDVFVLNKQNIFKGVFGFGSKVCVPICHYPFSYKVTLFSSFFGPFKCILAKNKDHIVNLLFKSNYKLCTPIWAILLLNASTDPPKNDRKVAHVSRRATSMKNLIGQKKSDFWPFFPFFCKFHARHIKKKNEKL